jgi:hypothetical protein
MPVFWASCMLFAKLLITVACLALRQTVSAAGEYRLIGRRTRVPAAQVTSRGTILGVLDCIVAGGGVIRLGLGTSGT